MSPTWIRAIVEKEAGPEPDPSKFRAQLEAVVEATLLREVEVQAKMALHGQPCTTCRFMVNYDKCEHPLLGEVPGFNPISGERYPKKPVACFDERFYSAENPPLYSRVKPLCGSEGRLWQPKDPPPAGPLTRAWRLLFGDDEQ